MYFFQIVAMCCLVQILREDSLGSQTITMAFVRSGNLRHILDTVKSLALDSQNEVASLRTLIQFKIILVSFSNTHKVQNCN